jgi:thiamine biosynthesis lipoprotein
MTFRSFLSQLVLAGGLLSCLPAVQAETFPFFREHVLGTSLEVQVEADTFAAAQAAEKAVVDEIVRQAKIFSSYDADSELSRWQKQAGVPTALSPELTDILRASQRWQTASRGAFNPAIEGLTQLWQAAAKSGVEPAAESLAGVVKVIQAPVWTLDEKSGQVTRLSDAPLTFNAIAKGAIVDQACEKASKTPGVAGLLVSIGGDMRVCGSFVRRISIADPRSDAVNSAPLQSVYLAEGGLATSGDYRRGFQIGTTWHSHILDPRTGRPAEGIASATVVAPTTMEADALATICNVLSVEESLALMAATPGTECLIVTDKGDLHQSPGWADHTQPALYRLAQKAQFVAAEGEEKPAAESKDAKERAKPELLTLEVKFELARPEGPAYRRPYTAVWLEDADEFPVRTAVLWMTTKQPGPRWHRDLIRWYRNDRARKLADDADLIGTISGATRGPGQYKAVFDGLDDAGQPLKAGKYTLYIEVAREHGTYQIIRQSLTLGSAPIPAANLKPNVEVKSASYEYRAPADDDAKPAAE